MNDGMRSREGMDVGDFPPHMPVYSGHFHKPHTVKKALSSLRCALLLLLLLLFTCSSLALILLTLP